MNKSKKQKIRGSISIFLTIILVPMISLSGLIVDASRVQLAKSMVSSAGDLTMNSGLANYDTVLKDVYGLFAMSQNEEDLSNNLKKYFEDTLISNGVVGDKEDITTNPLLKDISAAFSGKSSNLMKMELNSFSAKPVLNSNLAQPFILKNQIVEFEKYRAPINTSLSLLDSIAAFSKFSKQAEVTKHKVAVDEKAEDFNSACKSLYKKLKEYDDKVKGNTTVAGQPKGYNGTAWKEIYNGYKSSYQKINRTVVELMQDYPEPTYFINKDSDTQNKYPYSLDKYLSMNLKEEEKNFSTLESKLTSLKEEINKDKNFSKNVIGKLSSYANSIDNIQLSKRVEYFILYEEYINKIVKLESYYKLFRTAYVEGKDNKATYDEELRDMYQLMTIAYKISEAAKKNKTYISNAISSATETAKNCRVSIIGYEGWISDCLDMLNVAKSRINKVKDEAAAVEDENKKLQGAINNYNGKKNNGDSFSDGMQQEHDYNSRAFDLSSVKEIEDQIEAHEAYLKSLQTAFKSIKYANKSISSIDSFHSAKNTLLSNSDIKKSIENHIKNNPGNINDSYADDIFKKVFSADSYPAQNKPTSYISGLNGGFWRYLQQAFASKETESGDKKIKDSIIDNAKSKQDEASKTVSDISDSPIDKSGLPSGGITAMSQEIEKLNVDKKSNKGFSNLLGNMTSAVSNILNGIEHAAEAGRDNLYVVDYNFNMFSFYTQEAEYKVQNEGKDLDLKTCTGIGINKENNIMYRSEIEYILYGYDKPIDNVQNAKENIFAIRFVANAGYALTNAEIKGMTLPPALAIQTASAGLIPYKLPQVVMQLCLALAESTMDLNKMESGQKVAIIKTRDTWTMSPTGAAKELEDYANKMVTAKIKEKAGKIKGALGKLIDNTGDKVQVKIRDLINDVTISANAKATEAVGTIFNMFSDSIVASLDKLLQQGKDASKTANEKAEEILNDALNQIQNYINDTPDGILKSIMQQYFDSSIKQIGNNIKGKITEVINNLDNVSAGKLVTEAQQYVAQSIETALKNLSDEIKGKIQSVIDDFGENLKSQIGETIDTTSKELTDKAVNMTNEFFDKNFSKVSQEMPNVAGKKGKNNSIASMLLCGYSDYLKMFMFLKLCVNDDAIVKRTADVIQINVSKKFVDSNNNILYQHKKGNAFRMANANTYIEIESNVRLKTMFLDLPVITKYSGKGGSYFTVKYKSAIGY